eukprot:457651-Ditylum_brightwellii.AAC.1
MYLQKLEGGKLADMQGRHKVGVEHGCLGGKLIKLCLETKQKVYCYWGGDKQDKVVALLQCRMAQEVDVLFEMEPGECRADLHDLPSEGGCAFCALPCLGQLHS